MAVKIQLKVKFPQAVITKIRTLSPVFPKLFRTSVRRETRTATSNIMYVKPLICVVRFHYLQYLLLQYLVKCTLHFPSWRLKCWQRKYFSRKFVHHESKCWVSTKNVSIFSMKKYLPIQFMIPSCCRNSKHPWWSALF